MIFRQGPAGRSFFKIITEMDIKLSNKKQIALIIICWAIYTVAYLGRYSYTSNGVPIKRFYEVSSDEFSLATTFFFFAYGAGQILNGLFCRKYNMRFMLFGALAVSSAINLSVYLGLPFYLIKYLWLVNGLCQAVFWPSLLRILSCYLDEKHMRTAVVMMSTTVSMGTFLSFGSSALFALFDGFRYSFLLAAVCMAVIAVLWVTIYGKLTENARLENEKNYETEKPQEYKGGSISKGLLYIFAVFGMYAVATNFIKDGLTTWVPHILSEQYGLNDSLSIIFTLVLPIFGIFGAVSAVSMNRTIKDHSALTGVFFVLSFACTFGIVLILKTEYWYIILVFFGAVNMFMHGTNNVITSMLPLSVGKKYNAGLVGGVLNGACYVGSTLSQYVIAAIATARDWNTVMDMLLYLCVFAVVVAVIVRILRYIIKQKTNKEII